MNLQSKFGYCITTQPLKIALCKRDEITDRQSDRQTDDPITRYPQRTFQARGIKSGITPTKIYQNGWHKYLIWCSWKQSHINKFRQNVRKHCILVLFQSRIVSIYIFSYNNSMIVLIEAMKVEETWSCQFRLPVCGTEDRYNTWSFSWTPTMQSDMETITNILHEYSREINL